MSGKTSRLAAPRPGKLLSAVLVILTAVPVCSAQAKQVPSPPPEKQASTPSATGTKQSRNKKTKRKEPRPGTSNDRLFYALPNFMTVQGTEAPLTPGGKFRVVARSSFDYFQFTWYGLLAGISQAENSEPGYGQGWGAYGKRYGASFADGTIENFMTGAVLPSILRQDPRFYQSDRGGFWHRTGYAISRIVVTRSDSGHAQFNFSEVIGSALSAGISTYSYHPRADRTVSNTAKVWGTQIGYDTLMLGIKEFWPDLRRKVHKPRPEHP